MLTSRLTRKARGREAKFGVRHRPQVPTSSLTEGRIRCAWCQRLTGTQVHPGGTCSARCERMVNGGKRW
jgi:hypothetical protein